jgi:hypothetical protein
MRRNLNHVHLAGLSPEETRSLTATLFAAAIEAESDPGGGTIRIRRSRNRVFHPAQIETVIQEWLAANNARSAPHSVIEPTSEKLTPPATDDRPLITVGQPLRTSR